MLHSIVVWLLVVAFFGAGLFNAIGTRAIQDDFARWGYPRWWCVIAHRRLHDVQLRRGLSASVMFA